MLDEKNQGEVPIASTTGKVKAKVYLVNRSVDCGRDIEYIYLCFQVPFIVKWGHVVKELEEITFVIFEPNHLKVIQSLFFSLSNTKAHVLKCQHLHWPVSLSDYVDQSHVQRSPC